MTVCAELSDPLSLPDVIRPAGGNKKTKSVASLHGKVSKKLAFGVFIHEKICKVNTTNKWLPHLNCS